MDEKQKKQLLVIHNALTDEQCEKLWKLSKDLELVGRDILNDLSAFDVITGNSEKMLAANALMQIHKQVLMILTACDDE